MNLVNCYFLALYLFDLPFVETNQLVKSKDLLLHKKRKFFNSFISKFKQICQELWIYSQLLKKSWPENVIFCSVIFR